MPKVNLTNKSISDQIRILNDYLDRRSQHKEQGDIKVSQIIKRFKHKRWFNDKIKTQQIQKLLKMSGKENIQ